MQHALCARRLGGAVGLTAESVQTLVTEALGSHELSSSFESDPLLQWVSKLQHSQSESMRQLLAYLQIDRAVANFLGDTSSCSAYANNHKACHAAISGWSRVTCDLSIGYGL